MKTEQVAQPFGQAAAVSFPHYRGLSQAIFAGAFVFGVVMASLGALLPGLARRPDSTRGARGRSFW